MRGIVIWVAMVLVLCIVAVVVYTYCGAARAAGRSERDEAVATRVRGLIEREKEAIFAILVES